MSLKDKLPEPPWQSISAAQQQQMLAQMQTAAAQGIVNATNQQLANAYGIAMSQASLPTYGIDPATCASADELFVVYYLETSNGATSYSTIKEAYFPKNDTAMAFKGQFGELRYPRPAFATRKEAERGLRDILRGRLVEMSTKFLQQLTQMQFEGGITDNFECDLADALRTYLNKAAP